MTRQLDVKLLDADKFVKARDLQEVSNPVFFIRDNIPTDDGLLSNSIFGITKDERANTYAYIDLGGKFLHPLCYKIMCKLDSNIKACVHGTKLFKLDDKGFLVEDPNGKTGIDFITKNLDKLKFKSSDSNKRDRNIEFIERNRNNMTLTKMIVIPAFYRDVNTSGGYTGVGEINELYSGLIIASRSLKEMKDYGLDMPEATRGRIQEILTEIYTWFGDGPVVNGARNGNLAKKLGILRMSVMSKTTDYGSRLVLSAPMNNVEKYSDIKVDMKHSAVPLSSVIVNFYPFVLYHMRRFFENEFLGVDKYKSVNAKTGEVEELELDNVSIAFSDAELKRQMDIFIHSYDNRFVPIEVPIKDKSKGKVYMRFQGYAVTDEEYVNRQKGDTINITNPGAIGNIIDRDLTWCDVLYMSAVEATKDKMVLITRYPMDSYFNQFATKVIVSSTKDTDPVVVNDTYYPNYPHITQEDIGQSTGNKFIDTLQICNGFLNAIGGDYDGDQCSVRGIFTVEANKELEETMHQKKHYINLGSTNVRISEKEAVQAVYELTLTLPDNKLTDPVF